MTTRTRDRQPSEEQAVVDVAPIDLESSAQRLTRFQEVVRSMRALPVAARSDVAFELNELLIAMRAPGHESEESELILELLASKTLEGVVDPIGRSCRNEAVETMLSSGFPHALALDPEDAAFARTWNSGKATQPLAAWEQVLLRNRRMGAAVIGAGQVLAFLVALQTALFTQSPLLVVGPLLLTLVAAVVLGLARPRSANVGLLGGALAMLWLVHGFLAMGTSSSAFGVACSSMLVGMIVALDGVDRAAPDPDAPYWGRQNAPSWWRRTPAQGDWPTTDPWGRSTSDWNFGRDPTPGEIVPNPKGDYWKLKENKP